MRRSTHLFSAGLIGMAVLLGACGQSQPAATVGDATAAAATSAPAERSSATGPIRIGSKDFTEAILVAEMDAQLLEHAGYTVERRLNLGGTPVAHQALLSGDIDLYPEYTSTGLQEVLKAQDLPKDPTAILSKVREGYEQQFKLTWLEPAPFNDSNTFATTKEIAEKYHLKTYSDLVAQAPNLRLGGPAELPERQDTKGLEQAYGPFIGAFKEFKQLGTGGLRYDALQHGDVDVIAAFGTDGRIQSDGLVVLEDDKRFFPIYNIAPVIREDVLAKYPDIPAALNPLAPLLTDSAMAGLNYQVDGPDKRETADVAREFLQQHGLLK